MKTQDTQTNITEDAKLAIEKAAAEQAAKVAAQRKVEIAEYMAFLATDRTNQEQAGKVGPNVRAMLAVDCGRSVKGKHGRPEAAPYRRLSNALLAMGDKTFKEQARCYGISVGSIGIDEDNKMSAEDIKIAREKHVTGKGKANDGSASISLKMIKPASVAIAFGE